MNWFFKKKKNYIKNIKKFKKNLYINPKNSYHFKIGSKEYFEILFDNNQFIEINNKINFIKNINFIDKISYIEKLKKIKKKTNLSNATRTAYGKINNYNILIVCMDFNFLGGSMGLIVGEKISQAINYSIVKKTPLLIISKSGGARIMESSFALMQMAKISSRLLKLLKLKIPYISLMTSPTAGGVTASFAMLGDFNIAEPESLICFAGPRIIKETIGKELPYKYQNAENIIKNGFLDFIVDRRRIKNKITNLLKILT